MVELAKDVVPIVLAAIGAFILFVEARLAQRIEEVATKLFLTQREVERLRIAVRQVSEMEKLLSTDRREFLIRSVMDATEGSSPRSTIESVFRDFSNEAIDEAIAPYADFWRTVPAQLREAEHNLDIQTSLLEERARVTDDTRSRVIRRRKWLLYFGFLLITAASGIQIGVRLSERDASGGSSSTRSISTTIAPATAFLWFDRTWERGDRQAFERHAFRHGHGRRSLGVLYSRHPTVRRVFGIAW